MKLALDAARQGRASCTSPASVPLPPEYALHALDDLRRGRSRRRRRAGAARARLRERAPARARPDSCSSRRRSSSTSTTTTTTPASATSTWSSPDASSTGEILRDLLARARRRADARDRRGALHRARHRHRPLPVREHDAEGAAARGRAGRGRRGRPPRLPGRVRERRVREAEAARARARARAGLRGRPARRLATSSGSDFDDGRRGGAVRRGHHRLPARRRGRRAWSR